LGHIVLNNDTTLFAQNEWAGLTLPFGRGKSSILQSLAFYCRVILTSDQS
jgi:hypothetical protein